MTNVVEYDVYFDILLMVSIYIITYLFLRENTHTHTHKHTLNYTKVIQTSTLQYWEIWKSQTSKIYASQPTKESVRFYIAIYIYMCVRYKYA